MQPSPPETNLWKQTIGYLCTGIGILISIAALYGWLERLPPLTSSRYELFVSELIGLSLFIAGLYLTWPKTPNRDFKKRKNR